eukprot:5517510-Amphidinium_carterae.2
MNQALVFNSFGGSQFGNRSHVVTKSCAKAAPLKLALTVQVGCQISMTVPGTDQIWVPPLCPSVAALAAIVELGILVAVRSFQFSRPHPALATQRTF